MLPMPASTSSASIPRFVFLGKSSVKAMTFADADVTLGSIETDLAFDGDIEIDIASDIDELVTGAIKESIVGPFIEVLNRALGSGLELF
jgi:hypothetical protein